MENRQLLRFDNLSIDENDIRDCRDLAVLKEWKIQLDRTIELIRHKIDVEYFTNKYENSDWIIRAKAAKSKLGQLSQLMQNRLGELKRLEKQVAQSSMERRFYDAAYKTLDKELFYQIKAISEQNNA